MNMADKTDAMIRLFQIFSAKLVLEVFGGGGAIWGFSEAATLRYPETQEFWRYTAQIVGFIFLVRWVLQIRDYAHDCNGIPNPHEKDRSLKRIVQVFSAKMVLEVWGGAGAIWGFSEAMSLRRPETQEWYRFYALSIGCIFFIRWCFQIEQFRKGDDTKADASKDSYRRYFQIFSAKMVLEVFGGGGAIWGFSEVCNLRRPDTQEEWRVKALTMGFIFFLRFLCQTKDYFMRAKFGDVYTEPEIDKKIRLLQIFSAKLVLEVFGGGGAIWGFSEAMSLRRPDTQGFYRTMAVIVGVIFLGRWFCQIRDFMTDRKEADIAAKPAHDVQYSLPFVDKVDATESTPLVK